MTDPTVGDRDGARVHDIEVAGAEAYLGVRDPPAAADRVAFLGPLLGWADA